LGKLRVESKQTPERAIVPAILLGGSIAVCKALFVLFERPFMQRNWPGNYWKNFDEGQNIRFAESHA
jgi:hypothetical protein